MFLLRGPAVLECRRGGDVELPQLQLVFLRGHCRSLSRRCATTDAEWF